LPFGDELTHELVNCLNSIEGSYRAELRDLFDAQFGRFEEKLERRLAETTAQLRTELSGVKEELGAVEGRLAMLTWSFALWLPVALAVIGLYFKR
jgi:hypothetical protein